MAYTGCAGLSSARQVSSSGLDFPGYQRRPIIVLPRHPRTATELIAAPQPSAQVSASLDRQVTQAASALPAHKTHVKYAQPHPHAGRQQPISEFVVAHCRPAIPTIKQRQAESTRQPLAPQDTSAQAYTAVEESPKLSLKQRLRALKTMPALLTAMAVIIFLIGLGVSLSGWQTNRQVGGQVAALSSTAPDSKSANGSDPPPSTVKPTVAQVTGFNVAADHARYLIIPKIGVNTRVLSVGLTASGALGTPSNVYDAAWYNQSALPGQPGATLIDGHVSSWTTNGVFYKLKSLQAGDKIEVEKGDGTVLNYHVVMTQKYDADKVDMAAALTPVIAGKSGLNLITCTGQVVKGTSEFNQRLVVFASED